MMVDNSSRVTQGEIETFKIPLPIEKMTNNELKEFLNKKIDSLKAKDVAHHFFCGHKEAVISQVLSLPCTTQMSVSPVIIVSTLNRIYFHFVKALSRAIEYVNENEKELTSVHLFAKEINIKSFVIRPLKYKDIELLEKSNVIFLFKFFQKMDENNEFGVSYFSFISSLEYKELMYSRFKSVLEIFFSETVVSNFSFFDFCYYGCLLSFLSTLFLAHGASTELKENS